MSFWPHQQLFQQMPMMVNMNTMSLNMAGLPYPALATAPALHPLAPALPALPSASSEQTGDSAAEDESKDRKNVIEMQCNVTNHFNLNEILAKNILSSEYFKTLYELKTFPEVVDEIYNEVDHLEPFTGKLRMPSTAFCLLYKCFTMKLTKNQMHALLSHKDSPYIRGIGFLYLRFVADPKDLWDWFYPYLDDPEEFSPGGGENKSVKKTIGEFVRSLLTSDINYYETIFPRIPVPVARDFQRKMIAHDQQNQRAKGNERIRHLLKTGTKCQVEYFEDNKFYDAIINQVLENGNFLVTFCEYGNQEEVGIGAIKLSQSHSRSRSSSHGREKKKRSRSRENEKEKERRRDRSSSRDRDREYRDRDRDHRERDRERDRDRERERERDRRSSSSTRRENREKRKRSRSTSRSPREKTEKEIEEEILRKEREKALAHRRSDYAKRPASYKTALSMKQNTRRRSRTPPPPRRIESRPKPQESSPPRKKDISAESQARLDGLRAIYGDASASTKTSKKLMSASSSSSSSSSSSKDDVIRLGFDTKNKYTNTIKSQTNV